MQISYISRRPIFVKLLTHGAQGFVASAGRMCGALFCAEGRCEYMDMDYELLNDVIERNGCAESAAIAILQDVQETYRYLPREAFPYIAKRLGVSRARLYSIATFYENFSLAPKGEYLIKVCDGTACHVRKSAPILERLRRDLRLSGGETTTDDLRFTVETVSCLGACGLAPVITVNEKVYGGMTPESASVLLQELKEARRND
jgi:NADH-quinone oxidoreductase subunit E